MTEAQPVYILVGGVSHTPVFFEKLIAELKQLDHDAAAVPWASCTRIESEDFKQQDDVDAIRNFVVSYLDGKNVNVVLVLHSYAGWPGSRAIKGLDLETRQTRGKTTGIIEAIFIAAFLLPDNAPMAPYSRLPQWLTVENNRRKPNEQAIPKLFSDLGAEEQAKWFSELVWQHNDFTAETVPDAPWHLSLPKTAILCTQDQTAPLDIQFKMLQSVIDHTWTIKSINSGHEPFLSQPAKLAKILLQKSH